MPTRTGWPGTTSAGDIVTSANIDDLPGGWLGYTTRDTNLTGITSASGETDFITTLTVTTATDRLLKVTVHLPDITETGVTANAFATVKLTDGSNGEINRVDVSGDDDNTWGGSITHVMVPNATTESFKVRLLVSVGTWTVAAASAYPALLLVEDIGPSS
jgi:hypothetical protein